ncbi:MAG: methyltransferase domain-containing protein [Chloroflexota bacterium]
MNTSYNPSKSSLAFEAEIQRLRAQALRGWPKEARNFQRFGLADGMQILEIGSGPGFITGQLLELCPQSQLTSLEIDPLMIDTAQQQLSAEQRSRTRFVQASIVSTGLPDNQFDFAIARMIFLHLPDPLGAAREIYRLLRPGGKLVVIDIDDGIFGLIDPQIPGLPAVMHKLAQAQASRGGNRYIGRRLWKILQSVGFTHLDLEAVVQHSDALGIDAFRPHLDIQRISALAKAGMLTQQEYEDLQAASEEFWASPEAYALMIFLMVCGEKPA